MTALAHSIRRREIELVIREILPFQGRLRRILEIGSGDGFQTPYLGTIGRVFASDVALRVPRPQIERFALASAESLPYANGTFELIFSSNVLEHIEQRSRAFHEMKRVATRDAIFVHVLPTHVWKALSMIAHYPLLGVAAARRLARKGQQGEVRSLAHALPARRRPLWRRLFPEVHGTNPTHRGEFVEFMPSSWRKTFSDNGFVCLTTVPLLTYGPGEMSLLPPNRLLARAGLPSSVLFILKNAESGRAPVE